MGLVVLRTEEGRPGRVYTRNVRGNIARSIEIDLAASDYEEGGWVLDAGITGLTEIWDADQPSMFDPYGDPVHTYGCQLVVVKSATDVRLKVYMDGVEAMSNWSGDPGERAWIRLIGVG